MMNNPPFLGNNFCDQNISRVLILSDVGDNAQKNQEENNQIMNNTDVLGNNNGTQDIPRVLIFSDVEGDKAQNNQEENTQTTNNTHVLGNNNGARDIPCVARVLIIYNDEMNRAQIQQEENTQMMNNPEVLGNNNDGQDTPRVLIQSHDSSTEIKPETTTYPSSMKSEEKQEDIDSGSPFITPGYGFVGDPKRNVTIPRMHLVIAQRKPQPKHAARYLVRNLFPREVLICSTANTQLPNSSGRQPLDPNIMAALREYLITIFPNHDLRECGRDWRACISYVNALIRYLCNAAKKNTKTVPTKRSTPASVDLDIKSEDDADEGSSQLPRQAAAPEISASGNSQPNISAVFEEFEEPSASASLSRYRTLCYIGNPNRNVQVTFLVLTIARKKACPQMAASYLLSQLFSEEVLLNSIIYGSLWPGVCALSSNRINAIREFLQDNYPACDLSEGGREWKMCVNSMNQHIHTLKPGHGNFPFQPSSSSNTSSSSSKSESDTDLSDQNT
ncbi:BEN domain-containing protein 2 [Pipistrellus kuhlii]|uniref:BEN domain-containing protein 2 n=1 Tax=Pipistrellus kuhlii TaxID=59472 RepID=UPI00174F46BB|nr:BEN domain-containing protein 2 [Pipistrellus kuhlii]